jgi:hypothetical protein
MSSQVMSVAPTRRRRQEDARGQQKTKNRALAKRAVLVAAHIVREIPFLNDLPHRQSTGRGKAKFVFDRKEEHLVLGGGALVVPAGTYHNVINTSATKPVKLYTIYTLPTFAT